jgi:hypothetical protein
VLIELTRLAMLKFIVMFANAKGDGISNIDNAVSRALA